MNKVVITEQYQECLPRILNKGRAKSYMPEVGNTADRVLNDIGLRDIFVAIQDCQGAFPIQKYPKFVQKALGEIYGEAQRLTLGKNGSLHTFAKNRLSKSPLPKFDALTSISFSKALMQSVTVQEEVRFLLELENTRLQKKTRQLGQRIAENQRRLAEEEAKRALIKEDIRRKISNSWAKTHKENVNTIRKIHQHMELSATQTLWRMKKGEDTSPREIRRSEKVAAPKRHQALQGYIADWRKRRDHSLSKSIVLMNKKLAKVAE